MYEVCYKKSATKGLLKLPAKQSRQMVAALQAIARDPQRGDYDTKPLVNRPGHRLRIGRWRAIYRLDHGASLLVVLDIGARGDMYT